MDFKRPDHFLNITPILVGGLLFITPLISARTGIFEYEFARIWLVSLVSTAAAVILITPYLVNTPKKIHISKPLFLLLVWWIVNIMASLLGTSVKDSMFGRYGIWIFSVYILTILIALSFTTAQILYHRKNKLLDWLISVIAIIPILYFLEFILQPDHYFFINTLFTTTERLGSTFRNPNHLGFFLSLVLSITSLNIFFVKSRVTKYLLMLSSLSSCILLIMTQSRGSWISFSLSLLIFTVVFVKKAKPFSRIVSKYSIAVVISILAIVFMFSTIITNRITSTFASFNESRSSLNIRLNEWRTGINIWFHEDWVWGIGPENTDLAFPKYRAIAMNSVPEEWQWRTVTIRSYWIEILATTGIIGFACWHILHLYCIYISFKNLPAYSLFFITFYLHSLVYTHSIATLLLFYVAVGILIFKSPKWKTVTISLPITRITIFALIIISLTNIWLLVKVFKSESLNQQSLQVLATDPQQAHQLSKTAFQVNPVFDKNLRQLLVIENEILMNNAAPGSRAERIEQYQQHLIQLETRHPHDVENLKTLTSGWMRYAGFTNTSYDKAIAYGSLLTKFDATSPGSWDTLGVVYLDAKQFAKARAVYEYIITKLKPDYAYAYFHLGETYRQMGKPEKAISLYQRAIELGYNGGYREIEEAVVEINQDN